jgi:endonuclease/exonuclease/phosphatase family metal-dependent hydrolase
VTLRVATWNLNHWRQPLLPADTRRAAWCHLADTLGVQVGLVQEAVPPLDLPPTRSVYGEIAGHRNWGSAVVALDPAASIRPLRSVRMPWSRRRYLLEKTHPGSVAVAELAVEGIQPITLVSVYGVMDGPVLSTMHRVIADLVPLFDSSHGARVILGGDLNVSRSTNDARQLARAEAVFAALRALGLVEVKTLVAEPPPPTADCPCGGDGCDHVPTWGRAELDHLFVSPSLAGQVTAFRADAEAVTAGLSDHVPLVLDLALSPERTPHVWDEESFAEEVGRRHGAAARDAIERLVDWADHKERELASASGVRTKTLTRFPTNGSTTEPEMWWQVDLELEPKGIQYTISIRARGEVVVHFGNMRHPPFDTKAARNVLRHALNEMDGVDISWAQLRYWPRFPISVLEDPANLARLVGVLDRIATESHPAPRVVVAEVAADAEPVAEPVPEPVAASAAG